MKIFTQSIPLPDPRQLAHWVAEHPPAIWLDSAFAGHPRSRYGLLALEPLGVIRVTETGEGTLESGGKSLRLPQPFQFIDEWLKSHPLLPDPHPFFTGGVLGFLSYESFGSRFPLKPRHRVPGLPDALFLLIDSGLVLDHEQHRAWVFSCGLGEDLKSSDPRLAEAKCRAWINRLAATKPRSPATLSLSSLRANFTREEYLAKVQEIREAIFRGDCYQVNLSQKFVAEGQWNSAELYLRLRERSPAPQMAFLNLGPYQVLSASPETLLSVHGSTIESFPFKGTRPRHPEARQDALQAKALLQSPKDAAELLMIVDLVRNDLGQFCEAGSITVPHLKTLEMFPQVHHLVATVTGKMSPNCTPLQALLQMSPGGSVTGAPKLKAMEMINSLETVPRGIFTGSIGAIDFGGRSAFNIAIRTAFLQKERLEYSAGGGIVADSEPELEWEETLHKAEGFFQTIGINKKNLLS